MRLSVLMALAAASMFGAATPLGKILIERANPFSLAGFLYLGAAAALCIPAMRRGLLGRIASVSGKNRIFLVVSVVCGGIVGPVLLLIGLKVSKSASVSLWLNLELVATALLGHFFFKDFLTVPSALAVAGIFSASVVLSLDSSLGGLIGGLFVAGACVAWGLDNHATALMDGLDPVESTFLKGFFAGWTNVAIGACLQTGDSFTATFVGAALLVGALSYGTSIVLYISAAHGLGATRAQIFFSTSPLFGLLLAVILVGESIMLRQIVALGIMVSSYIVLGFEQHSHDHEHHPESHTHWHRHPDPHHVHSNDEHNAFVRFFGHSHAHTHEALVHDHRHVPDIHHRHYQYLRK